VEVAAAAEAVLPAPAPGAHAFIGTEAARGFTPRSRGWGALGYLSPPAEEVGGGGGGEGEGEVKEGEEGEVVGIPGGGSTGVATR